MRAVVWKKPFQVVVGEVPKPELTHPDDIIVKVTTAGICGSDLHIYEGRTLAKGDIVFGHENLGIVHEVGTGVTLLKRGDRVVMPFNVSCGRCANCEQGRPAYCMITNPGATAAAYGYVGMGDYQGGQAEYVKIPFADYNALKLPPGTEHEADFALLSDIFPTGWHGVQLSGFRPGESIAIFGAGPVGLMAAYSANLRGASEVYVVDRVPERLQKAKEIGCIPIDFSVGDPAEQIKKLRCGREVDRGVDAVGYRAVAADGSDKANAVLEGLIDVVKPTGGIGVPGLYFPVDPGSADSNASKGYLLFPFGKVFLKGLTIGTGLCDVKAYNRYLRDLIIAGKAKPAFVVSHQLKLEDAPLAYEKFDKRADGYTKILLHP
ncbi:GroES-like protein [Fomitiporia mediterranea MF3/22]|uniref:GroES-like protein n=1 Tax=Fomitiporia mediterranea (strain MF3/22) TaxID=694068 RepID=UPI0004408A68|nr:GroES-like protein [Fomitiporia mediterranea MF3/22]EJD05599.1 GroES-like protein [Fomitiporia mediterranea MF3/22]